MLKLPLLLLSQMLDINNMSKGKALVQNRRIHAQLGLPGLAIQVVVVCTGLEIEPFGPAKWSGPRLLSTVL